MLLVYMDSEVGWAIAVPCKEATMSPCRLVRVAYTSLTFGALRKVAVVEYHRAVSHVLLGSPVGTIAFRDELKRGLGVE